MGSSEPRTPPGASAGGHGTAGEHTGLPTEALPGYVGPNEAAEALAEFDANYLANEARANASADERRFSSDPEQGMRYFAGPPLQTAMFAIFGLLLFFGQFAVPWLYALAGEAHPRSSGVIRLGMTIVGALLIFLAWPRRGFTIETEQEMELREDAVETFRQRLANRRR